MSGQIRIALELDLDTLQSLKLLDFAVNMVRYKTIASSLATLVLAASAFDGTSANPSSTVNVWLRSNWDAPPLAIEIL
jgi:uncharacterized protein HemX